jgi:hypothetical protein
MLRDFATLGGMRHSVVCDTRWYATLGGMRHSVVVYIIRFKNSSNNLGISVYRIGASIVLDSAILSRRSVILDYIFLNTILTILS